MTELTPLDDPTPDLTDKERNLLRRAGASEYLIQVANTPLDGVERRDGRPVPRNSTLIEVKKYLRTWEALTEENAADFSHYGGGFFSHLWNGDLWKALGSADANNRAILIETFGVVKLNQERPARAEPIHG